MKQIKNLVCSLLLSVCGATMFTACSEDNEAIDAKDLELSKSELVFLAEPGEAQTVTFTANADWKATSEQGWILIDTPVGKKGESTVSVSVKQNPEKVSRQGNVIITEPSTGKMASFKVTQEAEGVNFAVNKEVGELAIDNENKVISDRISVVANFKYDIQIKDVDWVTYSIDEATKDIIFYADNEKATTEAKDIVVNFVPEEENVEAESWTLKWGGFTPIVEFYKDEACTQKIDQNGVELEMSMNGIQATIYTKSNVSWLIDTKIEGSILKKINYREETDKLSRIFEVASSFFVVYDDNMISRTDKEVLLNCKYEGGQEKQIRVIKKGVEDFTQIIDSVFSSLKGDDLVGDYFCPMFPATGDRLSLEFPVKSLNKHDQLDCFLMEYDSRTQTVQPLFNYKNITCEFKKDSIQVGEMNIMKYTLTLPDRSLVPGEEGEDRYFQMFIKPKSLNPGDFLNKYFIFGENGMRFDETKRNEVGSVIFGQLAYQNLFTFEPIVDEGAVTWVDKTFQISANAETIIIKFKTNAKVEEEKLFVTDNAKLSEPDSDGNKYIVEGNAFWGDDFVMLDTEHLQYKDEVYSLPFKVTENQGENAVERTKVITLGGVLSGNKIQYFGQFTIKQAAASSTTK